MNHTSADDFARGQEASLNQPGAQEHHILRSKVTKKYLQTKWNGEVVATQRHAGPFARYRLHPDPTIAGAMRVQSVGLDDSAHYLVCTPNGNIIGGDGGLGHGLWRLESRASSDQDQAENSITIKSLPSERYLTVVSGGDVRLTACPEPGSYFTADREVVTAGKLQRMRSVARAVVNGVSTIIPKMAKPVDDSPPSYLQPEHIAQYERDGYIVCPQMIAAELMEAAKTKITEGLARGADRHKLLGFLGKERQSWTDEYNKAPEILALCNKSPALKTCEALLDAAIVAPDRGQIALRKPTTDGKDFALDLDWHIDAYEKFTAARFGVLVVCALSDWQADNMVRACTSSTTHQSHRATSLCTPALT